jgi:uncharacterized protein (DUF58 family)
MPAYPEYHAWRRLFSPLNTLLMLVAMFIVLLGGMPATPDQAAFAAFIAMILVTAWVMGLGTLKGVTVERRHRARVFEGDVVPLMLVLRQRGGLAQSLVIVEDQFPASLSIHHRHLVPLLTPRWEAQLNYYKEAERHRGLYMLGPVELYASDPMGVFSRTIEADCVTALTVYPRAVPLGGYQFLAAEPPMGPGMESHARVGQGEEIIGVRPYQNGDAVNRIHWRTSMRRGELHTMQTDTHVQTEVALFLDLTRGARFGTGAESTTETAVGCATAILTEAGALRHRISLHWARKEFESFPPGAGLAHLHLLLDRLALVSFGGELKFWEEAAPRAELLPRGARAIFIAVAGKTPLRVSSELIRRLTLKGIATDVILLDESKLVRLWRDQEPPRLEAPIVFERLTRELQHAGARVFPLTKGEGAKQLLPRAGEPIDEVRRVANVVSA